MKPNKPLNKKNYGSIPHLSSSKLGTGDYFISEGEERILTQKKRDKHDTILVFEKYDGSNVGIAKKNGKIIPLMRKGYDAITSPYKQHLLFAYWVDAKESLFQEILDEGERIVGEWLVQAHGIRYKVKNEDYPVVFYDMFDEYNQRYTYENFVHATYPIGMHYARKLYQGDAVHPTSLESILRKGDERYKAIDASPEGMVYRVERKGKVDFLAKWVRKDFEAGKYIIDVEEKDLVWNIPI